MSFTTDLKFFETRAFGETKRVRDAVTLKLATAVVQDTPVDTGRLRGAWLTNAGKPDTESEPDTKSGSEAIQRAKQALAPAKPEESIFLTNNLPYARAIEEGRSKQAPAGMVRKNVVRFQRLIDAEAARRSR